MIFSDVAPGITWANVERGLDLIGDYCRDKKLDSLSALVVSPGIEISTEWYDDRGRKNKRPNSRFDRYWSHVVPGWRKIDIDKQKDRFRWWLSERLRNLESRVESQTEYPVDSPRTSIKADQKPA